MLRVNGYDIRNAIRRWLDRADRAAARLSDSLWAFSDESKAPVTEVIRQFQESSVAVVRLELLQQRYNQNPVEVNGIKVSLAEAVMMQGPMGRVEKLWKFVATDKGTDRYSSRSNSRSMSEEYAKRTITEEEAAKHGEMAARGAAQVRRAVAVGNNTEIEVNDPDLEKYLKA